MTSRRSHHRSRRSSRSQGHRHISRLPSVSSGFSHPSLEPKRRLRFQTESNPPPLVSTNTASGFSGFSAVSATTSNSSTRDNVVHGVQPDMRNLIRQISTEELRSTTASRKRSRSLSSSEGRDRRVRRNSPSLSNPSNMDKTSQSTCNTDSTEIGDRGPGAKSPVVTESTDNIFSVIQEPEILLRPEPGEKIDDSGDESGDQENEESDNLVQTSLASQLSYVEALVSLHSRLGPQLCPELTQPETQSGASALDFFNKKSTETVQPVLPQSRLILEQISKINSKIQGTNPIQGSPLDSYPKGMGNNRFPSLMMKPKVFGQDLYKIADPTLQLNPPPIDPSFREILRQGARVDFTAYLDKCALDSSMKASLRVQPLESSTLFGS